MYIFNILNANDKKIITLATGDFLKLALKMASRDFSSGRGI